MKMPGFTAEAALYKTSENYQLALNQTDRAEGQVVASFISFTALSLYTCWWRCWRDPTGHLYCWRRCIWG
jgi:hypothetical protein